MQKTTQIPFYNSSYLIWLGVIITTIASATSVQAAQIHFSSDRNSFDLKRNNSLESTDVATDSEQIPAGNRSNLLKIASTRGINMNVDNSSSISPVIPRLMFQSRQASNRVIATNFANGDYIIFTGLSPQVTPAMEDAHSINDLIGKKVRVFEHDIRQGRFSLLGNDSALLSGASSKTAKISKVESLSNVPDTAIGVNDANLRSSAPAPEPVTILGTVLAGGIGILMKKRQN